MKNITKNIHSKAGESGVIQIFRRFHMNRLTTQFGDKFITVNNKLILEIRITYGEQPPLR